MKGKGNLDTQFRDIKGIGVPTPAGWRRARERFDSGIPGLVIDATDFGDSQAALDRLAAPYPPFFLRAGDDARTTARAKVRWRAMPVEVGKDSGI